MKDFIRQRLHENWGWEEEPMESTPLSVDLENISKSNLGGFALAQTLRDIENKYAPEYAEYEGDTYGVIDAIKRVISPRLKPIYDEMHPKVTYESTHMNESDELEMRFNNGTFNKSGANTIYMDGNPIIDFGVGGIGDMVIGGQTIPNALYLKGGYNASEQGKGYGTAGIKFIFQKLPKIQNIVLQCFDTACPFWNKMGAQEITTKKLESGHVLRTLKISRNSFE
jgi:hypothetical protein